jgi:hypothetical protein
MSILKELFVLPSKQPQNASNYTKYSQRGKDG